MPVEIKELVIRAVAVEDGGVDAGQGRVESDSAPALDEARIVQECVREVLRILRRTRER